MENYDAVGVKVKELAASVRSLVLSLADQHDAFRRAREFCRCSREAWTEFYSAWVLRQPVSDWTKRDLSDALDEGLNALDSLRFDKNLDSDSRLKIASYHVNIFRRRQLLASLVNSGEEAVHREYLKWLFPDEEVFAPAKSEEVSASDIALV